jgi:hypothetical protein
VPAAGALINLINPFDQMASLQQPIASVNSRRFLGRLSTRLLNSTCSVFCAELKAAAPLAVDVVNFDDVCELLGAKQQFATKQLTRITGRRN